MKIFETENDIEDNRLNAKSLSLIPTMGNLHDGHLSLIKEAKNYNDKTIVSIFINPLQFGPNEDFKNYPRTVVSDIKKLKKIDCDYAFIPQDNFAKELELIKAPSISKKLCGKNRPGHFDGVATIVSKLFNMVQPDEAVFGEKDFQQLMVIRKLVKDLCFPVEVISVATCREEDGLAKSSRNGYLDPEERKLGKYLYLVLLETKAALEEGGRDFASIRLEAITSLTEYGFKLDYFNIASVETLLPAKEGDVDIVILAAAYMGTTRLIDNIRVLL